MIAYLQGKDVTVDVPDDIGDKELGDLSKGFGSHVPEAGPPAAPAPESPAKVEPANAEPAKADPAKADPAKAGWIPHFYESYIKPALGALGPLGLAGQVAENVPSPLADTAVAAGESALLNLPPTAGPAALPGELTSTPEARAFSGRAIDAFTFGLTKPVLDPMLADEYKDHPVYATAGQITGDLGSLLAVGGALKVAGLAGEAADLGAKGAEYVASAPRFLPRAIMTGATFGTKTFVDKTIKAFQDGGVDPAEFGRAVLLQSVGGAAFGGIGGIAKMPLAVASAAGVMFTMSKMEGGSNAEAGLSATVGAAFEMVGSFGRSEALNREAIDTVADSISNYAKKMDPGLNPDMADAIGKGIVEREAAKVGGVDAIVKGETGKENTLELIEGINQKIRQGKIRAPMQDATAQAKIETGAESASPASTVSPASPPALEPGTPGESAPAPGTPSQERAISPSTESTLPAPAETGPVREGSLHTVFAPTPVSSQPSIAEHPDFIKMTHDANAVAQHYAEQRGVVPDAKFGKSLWQEMHDALGEIGEAPMADRMKVRAAIIAKYPDIEKEFLTLRDKVWSDATEGFFQSSVAGKYGHLRPKLGIEAEDAFLRGTPRAMPEAVPEKPVSPTENAVPSDVPTAPKKSLKFDAQGLPIRKPGSVVSKVQLADGQVAKITHQMILDEAESLHSQALEARGSAGALEKFVMDSGKIRNFKADEAGNVPEAEEMRSVPVRFQGGQHTPDEMAQMAFDRGLLPEPSADLLRAELEAIHVRGESPKLANFYDEAQHNLEKMFGGQKEDLPDWVTQDQGGTDEVAAEKRAAYQIWTDLHQAIKEYKSAPNVGDLRQVARLKELLDTPLGKKITEHSQSLLKAIADKDDMVTIFRGGPEDVSAKSDAGWSTDLFVAMTFASSHEGDIIVAKVPRTDVLYHDDVINEKTRGEISGEGEAILRNMDSAKVIKSVTLPKVEEEESFSTLGYPHDKIHAFVEKELGRFENKPLPHLEGIFGGQMDDAANYSAQNTKDIQAKAKAAAEEVLRSNKIDDRVLVQLVDAIKVDDEAFKAGYGKDANPDDYTFKGETRAVDEKKIQAVINLAKGATEETGRHEAFHAVTNLLLEESEKKTLLDAFGDFEKASDAFAEFKADKPQTAIEKIFKKIRDFLAKLKAYFTKEKLETPEDIFKAVEEGRIAERATRGQTALSAYQAAFHGSPYKFDKFDLNKIGSGEGNQAYGWGLYFAGKKDVAQYYREQLAGRLEFFKKDGEPISRTGPTEKQDAFTILARAFEDVGPADMFDAARDGVKRMPYHGVRPDIAKQNGGNPDFQLAARAQRILAAIDELEKEGVTAKKNIGGSLFKVDIPDDKEFLNHDAILADQSPSVKKIIDKLAKKLKLDPFESTGENFYNALSEDLGSDQKASEFLSKKGIPGIQYLDEQSRKEGDGTSNYVIFDDKRVKILAQYQAQKKANVFFSQVEKTVDEKMPAKASPEQVLGLLKNTAGVKQEEMDWMGLPEFLKGKQSVTKEEIQNFIKENNVQVQEVMKGDAPPKTNEKEIAALRRRMERQYERTGDYAGLDIQLAELEGDIGPAEQTKFSQYTLPGGENYRELLLTLPIKQAMPFDKYLSKYRETFPTSSTKSNLVRAITDDEVKKMWENGQILPSLKESERFQSSHFSEPNILAHVRFNDRISADGKKTLFIEEVQSDWHQKGRERGYQGQAPRWDSDASLFKIEHTNQNEPNPLIKVSDKNGAFITYYPDFGAASEKEALEEAKKIVLRGKPDPDQVPNAPFKKTWHELALKRMLRYAAENGYDQIAWTTGEQQAVRYDLSKQVDSVSYQPKTKSLYATKDGQDVLREYNVEPSDIEKYIGKEASRKLLEAPPDDTATQELSGQSLKVGGEGMKGFYDQIVPSFLNKYAKKWGGKVGETNIDVGNDVEFIPEYTGPDYSIEELEKKERSLHLNSALTQQYAYIIRMINGGSTFKRAIEREGSNALAQKLGGSFSETPRLTKNVHSLPITPDMKDSVLTKGQPLYSAEKGSDPAERYNKLKEEGIARGMRRGEAAKWAKEQILNDNAEPTVFPAAPEEKIATLNDTVESIKEVGSEIRDLLVPAKSAPHAAEILRENLAKMARSYDKAETALEKASNLFDTYTPQQLTDFIDKMEHGEAQASPALDTIAAALRKLLDLKRQKVQDLGTGKLESFIENYFPHIWDQSERTASKATMKAAKRPLEGSKAFLKKRTIEFFKDGIKLGLTPVSYNPVELTLLKMREMDKYIAAHQTLNALKEEGLAKFVRVGGEIPEGWTKIDDKISTVMVKSDMGMTIVGHYYTQEDAARLINNYLKPGLQKFATFRAYRYAGNLLNQFQLGFSAFHLGFTSMDSIVSKMALAVNQLSLGHPLRAIGDALQAPIAPIQNMLRGDKVLKAWMGTGTGLDEVMANAMESAGGRARMDQFYATKAWDQMKKYFSMGAPIRGLLHVPLALTELSSKPILEYIVPRQKLGIFADIMRMEMEHNPNMTHDEMRTIAQRAWDSVDNRMGQLVYDNLFWNKAFKDLLMGSVRSVGWNLGTIRELAGGVYDIKQIGQEKGRGINLSYRAAYLIALPIVVGIAGAIYQYLRTGKGPENLKDYFYPRTGGIDKNGMPARVSFPSYMKDIYHYSQAPIQTILNKLNPVLSLIDQTYTNKDFYGVKMRNEDDPIIRQLMSEAAAYLRFAEPFGLRNMQENIKAGNKSLSDIVEPWIGITPAPYDINQTDAEKMAHHISAEKASIGGRTQEQADHTKLMRELSRNFQAKLPEAETAMMDAFRNGKISTNDLTDLIRTSRMTPIQRLTHNFSADELARVIKVATPEEAAQLEHTMRIKDIRHKSKFVPQNSK